MSKNLSNMPQLPMGEIHTFLKKFTPTFDDVTLKRLAEIEAKGFDANSLSTLISPSNFPIESWDSQGRTMLHFAVLSSNIELVKTILAKSPILNAQDQKGYTPVCIAAKNNQTNIAKCLIEAGASVDVCTYEAVYPIHFASSSGNVELVEAILSSTYLSSPAAVTDNLLNTPLHDVSISLAARSHPSVDKDSGHFKVAELLIKKGGAKITTNIMGQSPISHLYKSSDETLSEWLLNLFDETSFPTYQDKIIISGETSTPESQDN